MENRSQFFAFFVILVLLVVFSFISIELAHIVDSKIITGKQKIYRDHLKNYIDQGYSMKIWHNEKYLIYSPHCNDCLPQVNNTGCYKDCVNFLNGSESTPVDAIVLYNYSDKVATCYCVYS